MLPELGWPPWSLEDVLLMAVEGYTAWTWLAGAEATCIVAQLISHRGSRMRSVKAKYGMVYFHLQALSRG